MGGPRVRRGRTLRGGAGTASAALPGRSSAPEGPESRGRPLVPSLLGGSWAVRHQALSWVLKTQPSGAAEPVTQSTGAVATPESKRAQGERRRPPGAWSAVTCPLPGSCPAEPTRVPAHGDLPWQALLRCQTAHQTQPLWAAPSLGSCRSGQAVGSRGLRRWLYPPWATPVPLGQLPHSQSQWLELAGYVTTALPSLMVTFFKFKQP